MRYRACYVLSMQEPPLRIRAPHARLRPAATDFAKLGVSRCLALSFALAAIAGATATAQDPATKGSTESSKPWRLDDALDTAAWLKLSGSVRVRYEGIEGQFRARNIGGARLVRNSDHLMVSRSLLKAEADFDDVGASVELIDARHYGAGVGSFLNTTIINPIDVLQGFGELRFDDGQEGTLHVRAGRETIDIGSRRLVARNRFRNTINAFDAIDVEWKPKAAAGGKGMRSLRAFWSLPVRRKPTDFAGLLDNDVEMDNETSHSQFFGAFFDTELGNATFEAYALGLLEFGSSTARRRYYTPGFRVFSKRAKNEVDFEVESALQFGDRFQGGREVDHFAQFVHMAIGYTFDAAWQPRVQFAYDFASGDSNPSDNKSGRFDTLFGARRWEYGPTGIFGAIARSNLSSPELRLEVKPDARCDAMFAWRGIWLAQGRDQWTTARLTDSTGLTSNFVGHQIEGRVRYNLVPKSLLFDVGAAHVFAGDFMNDVAQSRGEDSTYVYAQLNFTF